MYEQWLEMENFYYNNMWYFIITSSFFAFIFFPSLKYYKKRFSQIIIIVSIIIWCISGIYIGKGYHKYNELIQLSHYSNPANRYYDRKIFNVFPYSYSELTLYRTSYMKDYFEKIKLYETKTLTSQVEYLGKDDRYYYFAYNDEEYYYVGEKSIDFQQGIEETHRLGQYYFLKDHRFEDLGFIPESSKFFIKYIVPIDLQNLRVDSSIPLKAKYQTSMMVKGWIVP